MNPAIKNVLREILPPLLVKMAKPADRYGFSGDYPSWKAAQAECSGYDAPLILDKVREATRAVRDGKALFERDSVLFQKPDYNWPLLAMLLRIATLKGGALRVLDFGGSLGSTYAQCRPLFGGLAEVEWSVIEQPAFVAAGKEFETRELRFYPDVGACLRERKIDCLLFSSVLQYLEDPAGLVAECGRHGFEYILIDRTPFRFEGKDRIVVQRVWPEIYDASYPAWIFNFGAFPSKFAGYEPLFEFDAFDRMNLEDAYKGFLFAKRGGAGKPIGSAP
jgi:putative methyltransferase (TIGR04325 family)